MYYSLGCRYIFWPPQSGHKKFTKEMDKKILWMSVPSTFPRFFPTNIHSKTLKGKGSSINIWRHSFFEIFDLSLPLVTHFTKKASGVTSTFGTTPSILSGWHHLWMVPNGMFLCKLQLAGDHWGISIFHVEIFSNLIHMSLLSLSILRWS